MHIHFFSFSLWQSEYVSGQGEAAGTERYCSGLWGCIGWWELKLYEDCWNSSRYCLENTIDSHCFYCYSSIDLFSFLVVFFPEPSEEKIPEQNWQFWLFVSHEQPNDTVCCILSWRRLTAGRFLILLGYGCLQKLNKHCCQSITHY